MVIKRKKDCKIIFDNNNYYVETNQYFFKFNNEEDAKYFYNNCKSISVEFLRKFDWEGKIYLEFYPEDLELLIKGIEQLKFFLDKSLYYSSDKNTLKRKSLDCFYLYEYINTMYRNYVPKEKQNL